MSEYRLEFPAPCEWLSANDSRNRYQLATLRKVWREVTYVRAQAAKLPRWPYGRIEIRITDLSEVAS